MGLFAGAFICAFITATYLLVIMGIRPFYVPFNTFKFICAIGKKASISKNIKYFKENFKFQYTDERYNVWRSELKARDSFTQSENLALQTQTLKEINAEIKKREH